MTSDCPRRFPPTHHGSAVTASSAVFPAPIIRKHRISIAITVAIFEAGIELMPGLLATVPVAASVLVHVVRAWPVGPRPAVLSAKCAITFRGLGMVIGTPQASARAFTDPDRAPMGLVLVHRAGCPRAVNRAQVAHIGFTLLQAKVSGTVGIFTEQGRHTSLGVLSTRLSTRRGQFGASNHWWPTRCA